MNSFKVPVVRSDSRERGGVFWQIAMGILLGLLIVLTLVNVFTGYEFSDSGYTQSLAYRLMLGQQIYKDFDYVRTPLSPYLWWLPIRLGAGEIGIRWCVVAERLAIAVILAMVVWRKVGRADMGWLVGIAAYACLLGSQLLLPFPLYDGLLFAALMLLFVVHGWLVLAVLAAFAAAACKQSFYVLPPLMMLVGMYMPVRLWHKILALIIGIGLAYVGLTSGLMAELKALGGRPLDLAMIYELGYKNHVPIFKYNYLGTVAVAGLVFWLGVRSRFSRAEAGVIALIVSLTASALLQHLYQYLRNGVLLEDINPFSKYTGFSMLVFLIVVVFRELKGWQWTVKRIFKVQEPTLYAVLVFFVVWASALTWGLATCVPAYGFLMLGIVVMYPDQFRTARARGVVCAALLGLVLLFMVGRIGFPMRQDSILLGNVERDAMTGIWMPKAQKERLDNIIFLKREYAPCVVILVEGAQADWLAGTVPYLRSNWPMDVEMPTWQRATGDAAAGCLYAVDKDFRDLEGGIFQSSFTRWVLKNGRKIDSVGLYDIYAVGTVSGHR